MAKCYIGQLAYNGHGFYGWQKQKDFPTVQQAVLETVDKIFPTGKNNRAFAASRTDSGVHAFGQPLKVEVGRRIDEKEFEQLLNENFPSSLKIFDLKRINPSFKITHYTKDKEYFYFLSKNEHADHSFVQPIGNFNEEKFHQLSQAFLGKHDFTSFQIKSTVKGDMVRDISEIGLYNASQIPFFSYLPEDVFIFRIKGNGFLKQMVRLIVGSLVTAVQQNLGEEYINILLDRKIERRPFLMPPNSLFLYSVGYPFNEEYEERNVVDRMLWKEDEAFQEMKFFNSITPSLQSLKIPHQSFS
ncbi:MAG: tRNA pseudouridine(38-40) synthase TruA [Oligoflexia bacterium]|nr:tRNA pseudouridine(38-40) synthase TruA [Oligoflexia bacterium]